MGIAAHIQDIAVARTQKGKRMGLRVLEALVYAASEYGAYKVGIPLPITSMESRDIVQDLFYHSCLNISGKVVGMRIGFPPQRHGSFSAILYFVYDHQILYCPNLFPFFLNIPLPLL